MPRLRNLGVLFAALIGIASLSAMPRITEARIVLTPPSKVDRVVVYKSARRLALMRGYVVLREYRVALGRYPDGRKSQSGDARTT